MTQPFRLTSGGRIDRSRTLLFSFDGKNLQGHPGDTLASALLARVSLGMDALGLALPLRRPSLRAGLSPSLRPPALSPSSLVLSARARGAARPRAPSMRPERCFGRIFLALNSG